MLETDDRVHGIILRYKGNPDHEFCMSDWNSLKYGKGNETYRFPCAPNDRHLMRCQGGFVYFLVWLTQGRKFYRRV